MQRLPGPKRPMPPDFPEMFVLLGHKTIEDYYATGISQVKRWMAEFGEDRLIQLRRGYLRKLAAANGSTHTCGARSRRFPEMRCGNPALDWLPIRRVRRPYREDVWVAFDGRGKPCPAY